MFRAERPNRRRCRFVRKKNLFAKEKCLALVVVSIVVDVRVGCFLFVQFFKCFFRPIFFDKIRFKSFA